ncbi:NAD(P)/FAD-dependent oxidoreductase [Mycobacterium syngnathidarum]
MSSTTNGAATPKGSADHLVCIIGGGLSGLGVGAELRRSGIDDFVILERADDVGGTWRDNRYPGVGVDVPTFAYQFSYFLKPDWSRVFAKGHEVQGYIHDFVDHFALSPHIRFGTEATTKTWDEDNHVWRLALAGGGEITARFVVFAVGAYIERRPPEFVGLEEYTGKVLEPTDWDDDYPIIGKRVAVIGTGATSVQIIPSIAPQVSHLDVYQRTAIWILPKVDPRLPKWLQRALSRSPRFALANYHFANALAEVSLVKAIVNYSKAPYLQRIFEKFSYLLLLFLVRDPKLRRKLTPTYPFGGKRPSMSNNYWQTFGRDNVDLVTDPIDRFTETGILTKDGVHRPVDAVVLATGYRMAYDPAAYRDETRVTGADGFDLGTRFAKERLKAYEGWTMRGLPNYFMVFCGYSAIGGSWHLTIEGLARHVVRVVQEADRRQSTRTEIKSEALDRYHGMITEKAQSVLPYHLDCSTANSYYLDHHGDATVMRPTSVQEALNAAETFPLDDYEYASLTVTAESDGSAAPPPVRAS